MKLSRISTREQLMGRHQSRQVNLFQILLHGGCVLSMLLRLIMYCLALYIMNRVIDFP